MPKTQIEIAVKGTDNASKVLQNVKGQLDGLNRKVVEAGQVGKQATSVASAGIQAMNGTLNGAISGARGMASAIQGMGVAMNTALPVAAAVSAALFALKKAYDAIEAANERRAQALRDETAAMLDQAKAARDLVGTYESWSRQRQRMANMVADLRGYSPVQRKELEGEFMVNDLSAKTGESRLVAAAIGRLEAELAGYKALAEGPGTSDKVRKAAEESVQRTEKELDENRKALARLNDDIEYLRVAVQLNAKQQKDIVAEEKRKADEAAYKAQAAEAKAWAEWEEAVESTREQAIKQLEALAQRRDAEIEAFNRASFARSVSQATAGARSVSLEEVAKVAALQAAGFVRSSATGYTTSQGDAMREAEARAKTERYQEEMLSLVRSMEKKADVQQGGLSLDVMGF